MSMKEILKRSSNRVLESDTAKQMKKFGLLCSTIAVCGFSSCSTHTATYQNSRGYSEQVTRTSSGLSEGGLLEALGIGADVVIEGDHRRGHSNGYRGHYSSARPVDQRQACRSKAKLLYVAHD